ncbi:hypothetical protein J5226_07250 [Lysobacter sp. K5869]|uniref:hypothetical protein n=1 Tax=Lysobacter sp. K5869 TaxID=2820808 RepID=UPI001C06102D|nr:hypothetical protein [Lysobacter sp. K5869]QWP78185.1 hypothetical protein J5226_07250 [Lysobacter sp. K5869]
MRDDRDVKYKLIDIFEAGGIWARRNNPTLFASYGSFSGGKSAGSGSGTIGCSANAANALWGWGDSNDGAGRWRPIRSG